VENDNVTMALIAFVALLFFTWLPHSQAGWPDEAERQPDLRKLLVDLKPHVHAFQDQTKDGDVLTFTFPNRVSGRYVQVRTTESLSWVGWHKIELRVR
jgi:hypothetical protein